MTKSYPNSLADLITALTKLSPTDEEATYSIFEILGLHLDSKSEPEVRKVEGSKQPERVPDSSPKKDEKQTQNKSIPASPESNPSDTSVKSNEYSMPSKLTYLGKSYVDPPVWFHNPLPLKSTESYGSSIVSYPLSTLFIPNWTRSILVGALSTYNNSGPIDINKTIRKISLHEPLKEVPRHPWPTMVHGVQVLVDISEALEPFHKDITYLKSMIRKVAGSDKAQIMEFVGCPLWGVRSAKVNDWSDYHPPSSRTAVLLITDLGILQNPYITDQAGVRDWLSFAAIVRKAGCSLVAFVPYPQERWPKGLQNYMKIIQWDRTTSTSIIQQIVKKSL